MRPGAPRGSWRAGRRGGANDWGGPPKARQLLGDARRKPEGSMAREGAPKPSRASERDHLDAGGTDRAEPIVSGPRPQTGGTLFHPAPTPPLRVQAFALSESFLALRCCASAAPRCACAPHPGRHRQGTVQGTAKLSGSGPYVRPSALQPRPGTAGGGAGRLVVESPGRSDNCVCRCRLVGRGRPWPCGGGPGQARSASQTKGAPERPAPPRQSDVYRRARRRARTGAGLRPAWILA